MAYPQFQSLGCEVIGVSPDSRAVLQRFTAEKALPFPFASDPQRRTAADYGVKGLLRVQRATFVVARGGRIAAAFRHDINIPANISDALAAVGGLAATTG